MDNMDNDGCVHQEEDPLPPYDGIEVRSIRASYPQDWVAYNEAQTNEKLLFLQLLGELTAQVPKQTRTGAGRPSADLGEMIFACCLKIYLNFSLNSAYVTITHEMQSLFRND